MRFEVRNKAVFVARISTKIRTNTRLLVALMVAIYATN
jgi:translation initiation factor IF-1